MGRRLVARTRSPSSTRYVRHGVAPIAVIGNDASWMQIAREQVEMLGTSLGTRPAPHRLPQGRRGLRRRRPACSTDPARVDATLAEAKAIAQGGRPVCINVHLRETDFRKGSISILSRYFAALEKWFHKNAYSSAVISDSCSLSAP